MGVRVTIEQVDNGYVFSSFDEEVGESKILVYETPKQVIRALRQLFGLKLQGRPVLQHDETKVFDPFAEEDE